MSGLGSGVVVVCGAEQRQEETSRMLSLMQYVYTNENCFRQWDPTPIEQWGPRLLWHLRKTVAQDTDRANPHRRASVITFGGVVLAYLEHKKWAFSGQESQILLLEQRGNHKRMNL